MTSIKENIIFTYLHNNIFVQQDREILSSRYYVIDNKFTNTRGRVRLVLSMASQLLYFLFKISRASGTYIWFADYHAFMPVLLCKIFRKPSYLVVGGYDFIRDRASKYGVFTSKFRAYLVMYAIKNAKHVITVSDYMTRKVKYVSRRKNVHTIYNAIGLSGDFEMRDKRPLVLTVGHIYSKERYLIKGIPMFISLAIQEPDLDFVIVGAMYDEIKEWFGDKLPSNLQIFSKHPHQKTIKFYQQASIYCQLSRTESFCLSAAEAIYFGCYPVLTKHGALMELADDYVTYFNYSNRKLEFVLTQSLQVIDEKYLRIARENIIKKYNIDNRKTALFKILNLH